MRKHYFFMACMLAAGLTAHAEISAVSQLYGNYNAVYAWGFTDDKGEPDGEPSFLINPVIAAGQQSNQINITGLFPTHGSDFDLTADQPIVGTVDLNALTITIENGQVLGKDKYGTNSLSIMQFDQFSGEYSVPKSVTATINENGNIVFPIDYVIGCETSAKGYWYLYYTLILQPYSGKYVHDTNFYVGNYTTTFTWYTEDPNGQPLAPPVDSVNPNITADDSDPYGIKINDLFAYLSNKLDIAAEVLPSGDIKINNMQMWDFNNNGYQLIIFDTNLMLPDYVLASVDEQGRLVFPYEYAISMGHYKGFNYTFQGLYGYFDLVMTNTAGVKALKFDENAPVRYFNLNGLPVANPQKGQIVIKRQGNKAVKMIAH